MAYRLLLDENVEHEVGHRLENYGHDVEHVDFVPDLGKGASDATIGSFTEATERVLLTYDDDFVLSLKPSEYEAVLYVPDGTLPVDEVADAVHEISRYYPQEELRGVEYVGEAWL